MESTPVIQDTSGTVFDGDETDELDVSVEIIFGDWRMSLSARRSASRWRDAGCRHVGMNGAPPRKVKTSSKKFNTQTSDISALDPRRDHNLSIMLAGLGAKYQHRRYRVQLRV